MSLAEVYGAVLSYLGRHRWLVWFAVVYVFFLLEGFAWRSLKRMLQSDPREHDPRGELENLSNGLFANVTITFVHGTWARKGVWHHDNSEFHRRLRTALTGRPHPISCRFRSFLWTGANGVLDRADAADQFAREFLAFVGTSGTETAHFVVGHSHGGSVALAAILRNEEVARRVSGLACMATPFLVVTERDRRTKWLLAFGEAVVAFFAINLALGALLTVAPGGSNAMPQSIVTVTAAALAIYTARRSFVLAKIARANLVPGEGIRQALAERLLVIRAAGDEASAALGAAYILRWALVRAASTVGVIAAWPAQLLYGVAVALRLGRKRIGAIVVAVVLLLLWMQWVWPQQFKFQSYRVVGEVIITYFLTVNVVAGTAVAVRESVATVVHGLVSALVGMVTIPFGYDLFLATPYLIVAAEAVPPAHQVFDTPRVLQLKLKTSKELQHCVYDDPETAQAIADWIREKTSKLR